MESIVPQWRVKSKPKETYTYSISPRYFTHISEINKVTHKGAFRSSKESKELSREDNLPPLGVAFFTR
jgi:hypothetical protein